jgi:U6 snRNA-associated Sm-like protein LSm7
MAKKENILDFTAYMNKEIVVKFIGGREVKGVLRGYDTLVNLVLDETIEYLRDPEDSYKLTGDTRTLGLVVCRGGGVMAVYPTEGAAELDENPFL